MQLIYNTNESLKSLSQIFSEEHYLLGEAIFDRGGVQQCTKLKGNLWNILIQDEQVYEVEISGFNTKKQRNICDCASAQESGACEHIVAALIHLQKEQLQKELTHPKKKASKLTINTILANVSHEELIQFVKSNAKRDRNFLYSLKAVFASHIDMEDNAEKYASLLQPFVRAITSVGQKVSAADKRLAVKLIKEFHDQMEDQLALGNYTTALDIMKGTFGKVHYLYYNYEQHRAALYDVLKSINTNIVNLYHQPLAPKYKLELDKVIAEVATLSYYNFIDHENDPIRSLYIHKRKEPLEEIKAVLEENNTVPADETSVHIQMAIKCLILDIDHVIASVELTDQQWIEVSDQLLLWNEQKLAVTLLEKLQPAGKRNRTLEYALIDLYYNTDKPKKADAAAIALFTKNKEFRYLRRLIEYYKQDLPVKVKSQIDKLMQKHEDLRFRAMYYKQMGNDEALVTTLKEASDLQLLMEYDAYLYQKEYAQLEEAYTAAIEDYMNGHAGNNAATFIDEVLHHLTIIHAFKLTSSIKALLHKKYAHRYTNFEF